MPTEVRIDARRDFTRRVLPWLVSAAMLAFYALTLNHWVALGNVNVVAKVCGWLWTPTFGSPLYYLATLPFRWLPATAVPVALNWFSALCAALTLGLLARSVGLLPHDRTEAQQVRERNDFFLLTIRSAWFPPLLAALLCGLQLTFWEAATNGGSETFDLLMFAFVIWSLMEYRLDGRVWRLYSSAAVVGAGIAEGPSITGFFPLFIVAVIWVRKLMFFNWRFLLRMFLYGLAGFSLFLVAPVATVIFGKGLITFWEAIKLSLTAQFQVLKLYYLCGSSPLVYFDNLLPLFISLLPLLVLSIRWKFGDSSRLGSVLANITFHGIHAVFLGVSVWLVFDPPFSPREKGLGLTLYYLIVLSVGYYAGYFLLIFGKRRPREEAPPFLIGLFNKAVVAAVWVLGVLAVAGLLYKNGPLITATNGDMLSQFQSLIVKTLPSRGAMVMSDDPERLYLLQAALVRDGRAGDYLLLDTRSLLLPEYHRYLHETCPQKWPLLVKPQQTNMLNAYGMMQMMAMLEQSNELYYLHPSFGFYFEKFYLEPHGLIYKLKLLPTDTFLPPPPDKNLVAENDAFWDSAETTGLTSVANALAVPDPHVPESIAQHELARLHVPREPNATAAAIGAYCSRSLNFWGVALQQAGDLTDAAIYFRKAIQFNPDSVVAQVNLQANEGLAAGHPPVVDLETCVNRLGRFNSVEDAITEDGPFDDPSFCYAYGDALAHYGNYRQAVAPLARVLQFDPSFLAARIALAKIYALNRMPDRALSVLQEPLSQPGDLSTSDPSITEMNMLASAAYYQKNKLVEGTRLLETEVSRNPTNQALLTTVEEIYINRKMFSNAMAIANRGLLVTPNDPNWLFTKGYIYNQLQKYGDAITMLNAALAIQKDDAKALFQRGNAYMGNGNLDAARADFEKVRQAQTNLYEAAFNLGDIAWRQHDTNEAIRNFEIYLAHTATNAPHAQIASERLRELKPAARK